MLKPLPMQPPFTARIDQSIADQGLQNMLPASSLPTVSQTLGPELIQFQLLAQGTGQPTGSPLPRPMQFHLLEPDLHPKTSGEIGQLPISGKQCQGQGSLAFLVEDFDRSTPALALAVVDLAKVEHLPLDKLAAPAASVLHHAPVAMLLAVFDPRVALQKHYGHRFYAEISSCEETGSGLEPFWSTPSFI